MRRKLTIWICNNSAFLSKVSMAGAAGLGFTMIQVDEYLGAVLCWIVLACIIGFRARGASTRRTKTAWVVGAVLIGTLLPYWTNLKRGDRAWSAFFKSRRSLELSAQQAQVVVIGVKPVPVPADGTWAHVNVFYRNDGVLSARALGGCTTVTVNPDKITPQEIQHTQNSLLSWNGWKTQLRNKRDQDLAHGVLGQWFSFPDHQSEESEMLAVTLPRVLNRKWYAYVFTTFKYWDSSMDQDVLGVTESCVFFVNDLEINRTCGRNRTFLERQTFTHASITAP